MIKDDTPSTSSDQELLYRNLQHVLQFTGSLTSRDYLTNICKSVQLQYVVFADVRAEMYACVPLNLWSDTHAYRTPKCTRVPPETRSDRVLHDG